MGAAKRRAKRMTTSNAAAGDEPSLLSSWKFRLYLLGWLVLIGGALKVLDAI